MSYGDKVLHAEKRKIDEIINPATDIKTNVCTVDARLLANIVNSIQTGINAGEEKEIVQYIFNRPFCVDYENININSDLLFRNQNNKDALIKLISVSQVDRDSEAALGEILAKLFETSKSELEKKQIASLVNEKLPRNDELCKKVKKFYESQSTDTTNLVERRKNIWQKTNGFFEEIEGFTDKKRQRDNRSIMNLLFRECDYLQQSVVLKQEVRKLFKITDKELKEDNYIENAQLKKIKIYLLLKQISSLAYKKSKPEDQLQAIQKILNKDIDDFNYAPELIRYFGEDCDFNSSITFADDDGENDILFDKYDLINTFGSENDATSFIETNDTADTINKIKDYDIVLFHEINDKNTYADNCVESKVVNTKLSSKENFNADLKKVLHIYYSSDQKESILSALYANKAACEKVYNSNNQRNEITDFAKIVYETKNDPIKTDNYLEVYNKYYLHEELKGLGGVSTDGKYNVRKESNENFIRNDYSKYIITTSVLLNWLKLQAKSRNPMRDMTVTICDIENLPKMMEEYYQYIIYERDQKGDQSLTPIDNLIIKNAKTVHPKKAASLLNKLDKSKKCFKLLKIDDFELNELENVISVNNPHILFGANGDFSKDKNIAKRSILTEDDIFDKKHAKVSSSNLIKVGDSDADIRLPAYSSKISSSEYIKGIEQEIKKLVGSESEDVGNTNVDVDVATNTDVDVDLELLLSLNKKPPEIDGLDDKDCITAKNITSKMVELLQPDNNRFSQETKIFLANFFRSLECPLSELFEKITNQSSISEIYKYKDFNGANLRFSPEAFVHILQDYVKFGTTRWNGAFGDNELAVYQIKSQKSKHPMFVVAKSAKNLNNSIQNPVNNMFTAMPSDSTLTSENNTLLSEKYDYNKIMNIISAIRKRLAGDYIRQVFINNPAKVSAEYANYIANNAKELIGFANFLSTRPNYVKICNAVCYNFCKEQRIGKLKQSCSLVDPVNLSRGMMKIFQFLDELKRQNFVSDDFINHIPEVLDDNKYAIQTLYYLLLERKLKVAKSIIEYRILNNEKINVDINDPKEVLKYIKNNPIKIDDENEKEFSEIDFFSILNYGGKNVHFQDEQSYKYSHDVRIVDSFFDSGCVFCLPNLNIGKSVTVEYNDKGEINRYYPISKNNDDDDFAADLCNILLLMNKKYKRLADGTIDDGLLSPMQKAIAMNKIEITITFSRLFNDQNNTNILNQKLAYIFVYALKNAIETSQDNIYTDIYEAFRKMCQSDEAIIDECYNAIKNNKQNALMLLKCYSLTDANVILDIFNKIDHGQIFPDHTTPKDKIKLKELFYKMNVVKEKQDSENVDTSGFHLEAWGTAQGMQAYKIFQYSDELTCERIFYDWMYCNDPARRLQGFAANDKSIYAILDPDIAFDAFINQYGSTSPGNIKNLFRYCFASNNDGKYSILNDAEKRSYRDNPSKVEEDINILSAMMFGINDTEKKFDFIESLNNCSKNGLSWGTIKDLYTNYRVEFNDDIVMINSCISAVQQLFLMSKETCKNVNVQDINLLVKTLIKYNYPFFNFNNNERINTIFEQQKLQIIDFLSTSVIGIEHKLNLMEKFFAEFSNGEERYIIFNQNFAPFVALLKQCDEYINNNENKTIKLSRIAMQQLITKAYNAYLIGDKSPKKINSEIFFILEKIKTVQEEYEKALTDNNEQKQSNMINLGGKISLLMSEKSIEEIIKILKTIGNNNIANDDDILNKFDYIKEHLDEDVSYSDVTELYNIDLNEKYLNSGFTHKQLLATAKYRKKQKKDKESVLLSLDLCHKAVLDKTISDIKQHFGETRDNSVIKSINSSLNKITNKCSCLIKNVFSKYANSDKILKLLNKKYYSGKFIITSAELARTENLVLLDEILNNGNLGGFDKGADAKRKDVRMMKDTIEYVNSLTRVLLKDPTLAEKIFYKLDAKARNGTITEFEKLQLIAAFCTKHIKDQNKALHIEQMAAVILESYIGTSEEYSGNRKICRLGTGVGKTLTILFAMYYASINKKSPIALTTNQLLVDEMMGNAEENSIYKGHIFYINEKQELVDKAKNRIVPVSEINAILKDTRNLLFSTYSNFDFFRKKLLLNEGRHGIEIAKTLARQGQLCLDEVDSIIDPTTTNKMSVPASSTNGLKKLKLIEAIQDYYDLMEQCKLKKLISFEHFVYEGMPNNIPNPNKAILNNKLNEIRLRIADQLGYRDVNGRIAQYINSGVAQPLVLPSDDMDLIAKLLHSYCVAATYKNGEHFTVDTVGDSNVIYPIQNGVPNKSGAKYEQNVDLALKVRLQKEGYHFENITAQSQIVAESSNFGVYNYCNSTFGVSGTITGVKELFGPNGFSVNNIQSTYPKLLHTEYVRFSTTGPSPDYKNPVVDLIFLVNSFRDQEFNYTDEQLTDIIVDTVMSQYHLNDDAMNAWKDYLYLHGLQIIQERSRNENYCLSVLQNSNELKAFKSRLNSNLQKLKNGPLPNLIIPRILDLDKRTQLIDDNTVKDILKHNNNVFVFALTDRARGFDFPRSPHLIATSVVSKELDEQICGRTGRNDRNGFITYAYALSDNDYKKYSSIIAANNGNIDASVISKIMKQKSEDAVIEFKIKNQYFELVSEISDKMSVFLNLITENCKDKREEVYNNAYNIIGDFNNIIREKFDHIYNNFLLLKQSSTQENAQRMFEKQFGTFKKQIQKDLDQVYKAVYSCTYVENGTTIPKVETFIKKTDEIYRSITTKYIVPNNKVKEFNSQNIPIGDRTRKVEEGNSSIKLRDTNLTRQEDEQESENKNISEIFDPESIDQDSVIFLAGLGNADACNYNIESYSLNPDDNQQTERKMVNNNFYLDSNLIVAKKRIIEPNEDTEYRISDCDFAICGFSDLTNKNIDTKLNTLSPNTMIIVAVDYDDGCIPIVIKNSERKDIIDNPSLVKKKIIEFNNFKKYFTAQYDDLTTQKVQQMYISYIIRYYTECKRIPKISEIMQKYQNEFGTLSRNIDKAGHGDKKFGDQSDSNNKEDLKYFQIKTEHDNRFNAIMKIGIGCAKEVNCLHKKYDFNAKQNILDIDINDVNEKIDNFRKQIDRYSTFDMELTEDEKSRIVNNVDLLSDILFQKTNDIVLKIEKLEQEIFDNNNIDYETKKSLLDRCAMITSANNLVEQMKRIINICAETARMEALTLAGEKQKFLNDIDLHAAEHFLKDDKSWMEQININNVEEIAAKIDEIKNNRATAATVGKTISENITETDSMLKESLVNMHNNVIDNLNMIEKTIESIRKYKQKIAEIGNATICLTGFNSVNSWEAVKEEFQNDKIASSKIFEELRVNENISEKQKIEFEDQLIEKYTDNALNLLISPDNITKLFNEFSLTNYNPATNSNDPLYRNANCTEVEKSILNSILELYTEKFGDIQNTSGRKGIKINDKNDPDPDDYDEDEEMPKTARQIYEDAIKDFKKKVKEIVIDNIGKKLAELGQNNIKKEKVELFYNSLLNIFSCLNENYNKNKKEHSIIRENISKTIDAIASSFRDVKGSHGIFSAEFTKICQQAMPELASEINVKNILKQDTINKIKDALYDVDLETIKFIKKTLDSVVNKDINEMQNAVNAMRERGKDIPAVLKVFLVIATLGLVFLTEKGKKLFSRQEIVKQDEKFIPNLNDRDYLSGDISKEKKLNLNMRETDLSSASDDVITLDYDNTERRIHKDAKTNLNSAQSVSIS